MSNPDAPQLKHGGLDRKSKPAKVLDYITVKKGEKGGHIVEHHFTNYEHKSESYPFSKDDGEGALAHVAKHMGIEIPAGADEEEEEELEA